MEIKLVEAQYIVKKGSYIPIPSNLEVLWPGSGNEHLWYSYDGKKYYPIGVFNESDKKQVVSKDVKLQLSIELLRNDYDDKLLPEPAHTVQISAGVGGKLNLHTHLWISLFIPNYTLSIGVYWFQAIKPHLPGLFRIRIASPKHPDITELVTDIVVNDPNPRIAPHISAPIFEEDVVIEPPVKRARGSLPMTTTPPSLSSFAFATPSASSASSTSQPKKTATASAAALPPMSVSRSHKAKPASSTATPVTTTPAVPSVPLKKADSTKPPTKTPTNTYFLYDETQQTTLAADEDITTLIPVLQYPTQDIVRSVDKRLVRPLLKECQLHGSVLKVTLPQSLVIALADDRARINLLYTSKTPPHLTPVEIMTHNLPLLHTIEKYNIPSIHDILYRIQKESKTVIVNSEDVFRYLRSAFEVYFIHNILYSTEKSDEVYNNKIRYIYDNKKMLCECFGGIYLLRFIVFLVVGLDTSDNNTRGKIYTNSVLYCLSICVVYCILYTVLCSLCGLHVEYIMYSVYFVCIIIILFLTSPPSLFLCCHFRCRLLHFSTPYHLLLSLLVQSESPKGGHTQGSTGTGG